MDAGAQKKIEKFAVVLRDSSSPIEELRWSIEAFEAAGTLVACRAVLRNLTEMPERALVDLARVVLQKVVDGAKYPKRSTSPTDNLAHQCETSGWAEIYEWVEGYLKLEEKS